MSQVRPMIKGLAAHMQALTQEVSQDINKLNRQMDSANEIILALIEVVGKEQVEVAVKSARAAKAKQFEELQDAATLKMVEKGALIPTDVVTAETLVVGIDTLKDGTEHKVRMEMEYLAPEQQATFLGKKVGDVIVNEAKGASNRIVEIYKVDKAKIEEMMNPKPQVTESTDIVEDGVPVVQEGVVVLPKGKKGKKARKARA